MSGRKRYSKHDRRPRRHQSSHQKGHQKKVPRTSVAPYNFVRLPKKVYSVEDLDEYTIDLPDGMRKLWACHDIYIPNLNSGHIDLQITTETPTYVRCGPKVVNASDEDPNTNPHRQDFFHHGDENHPVIPGSSIRGMARTLIEIVSSGKMNGVEDDYLVYRAVADTTSLGDMYRGRLLYTDQEEGIWVEYPRREMQGGYLERDGLDWAIRPAVVHNEVSLFHVAYRAVGIKGHNPKQDYNKNDIIPVLVKPPVRKDHDKSRNFTLNMALVKEREDVVITRKLTEQEKRSFEKREYKHAVIVRSGEMNKKTMHCAIYEPDKTAGLIPIPSWMWAIYEEDRDMTRGMKTRKIRTAHDPLFFITDKEYVSDENPAGLMFFGPTMMFRIPYSQGIQDHIPAKLRDPEVTDIAEALFGTVSSKMTIKGRVFFEDASWDGTGTPFLDGSEGRRVTRDILSGPKPTSFQHYLEQLSEAREKLKHWDDKSTRIRGYKLYWHKKGVSESEILQGDVEVLDKVKTKKDKQRSIIRPVRAGTTFIGQIHFENLTDFELGALCFILQLPESKRHKLGMGKSLGMGSVRISTTVSLLDRNQRYSTMFSGESLETGLEVEESLENYMSVFTSRMISHYGEDVDDLWSVGRMKDLSELLEWESALDRARTRYLAMGEWRYRPVLPTATEVRIKEPMKEPAKHSRDTKW
ncbi:MAG: TIGR03986 family type III CRISPR-associated RAMP protein [Candidatus Thorarchaeota archaeon]